MKQRNLLSLGITAVLLFCVSFVQATIFVKPGGTGNGTSWNDAAGADLNALFNSFDGTTPTDVWFAQGEYQLKQKLAVKTKVNMYGGFVGTETQLSERPAGQRSTIRGGNFAMLQAAAELNSADATIIDGFIFTGTCQAIMTSGDYGNIYLFKNRNISNCIITGNLYQKSAGIALEDAVMTNCLIYNNKNTGWNGSVTLVSGSRMINCTVVNNKGIGGLRVSGLSKVYNSIIWGNETKTAYVDASTAEFVNCALYSYSSAQYANAQPLMTNCQTINSVNTQADGPNFVNPELGDYHLTALSTKCVDLGLNDPIAAIAKDLQGVNRLQNSTVDMGCFEGLYEPSTASFGSIIYVKKGGTGDGSSWSQALGRLDEAFLQLTLYDGCNRSIWVAEGEYPIYAPLQLPKSVSFYGGFAGSENSLAERPLAKRSTIRGGAFSFLNAAADASTPTMIDGFIFTGGSSTEASTMGVVLDQNRHISNCAFINNSFAREAGIKATSANVTNCLFDGIANANSGAVYLLGSANMTNCTVVNISGNRALRIGGTATVNNSIFWAIPNEIYVDGGTPAFNNSAILSTATWAGTHTGKSMTNCISIAAGNDEGPRFVNSSLKDYRLTASSPCLNSGDNGKVSGITVDFAGNARIQGDVVDMGCLEGSFDPIILGTLYVKPGGTGDGSSWAKALGSIEAALSSIGMSDGCGRDIWVAEGSYTMTRRLQLPTTVNLYGGFTGSEMNLSERDLQKKSTLVGGEFAALYAKAGTADSPTYIDGFIFTGTDRGYTWEDGVNGNIDLYAYRHIRNCVVYGNSYWKCAGIHASAGAKIINCLIYNNITTGSSACVALDNGAQVINSTIVNNGGGADASGTANNWGGLRLTHAADMAANTIVWGNSKFEVGKGNYPYQVRIDQAGAGKFYNCAVQEGDGASSFQFGNAQPGSTDNLVSLKVENSHASGPNFVDPQTANFRLSQSSPCVNIGDNAKVTDISFDLGGDNRLQGGTVDLGAYETAYSTGVLPIESTQPITIYPNPTRDQLRVVILGALQAEIYTMNGTLVVISEIPTNGQVNVSGLSAGIYQIIVRTETGCARSKFLKL